MGHVCRFTSRHTVLVWMMLISVGCRQQQDSGALAKALQLQTDGEPDAAIELLSGEDLETAIQASPFSSLKMSEQEFKAQLPWRRDELQAETLQLVPLIKRGAFRQIEELQAAETAGQPAEAKRLREQLQRLVAHLQSQDRLLIYQQLGSGIQMKLDQVSGETATRNMPES